MKFKEKLNYFWNVTLGEDYPEQIDIENSKDPSMKELKDSLERVEKLEQELKSSTTAKAGKGKSSKVVETVVINPKAIKAVTEVATQKQEEKATKVEDREIGE